MRLGLTPVKDVAIVQIGTLPERLTALEKGKVQAALLGITETLMAQKKGFNTLVSVSLPYQGAGVATTRAFIRERSSSQRVLSVEKSQFIPSAGQSFLTSSRLAGGCS